MKAENRLPEPGSELSACCMVWGVGGFTFSRSGPIYRLQSRPGNCRRYLALAPAFFWGRSGLKRALHVPLEPFELYCTVFPLKPTPLYDARIMLTFRHFNTSSAIQAALIISGVCRSLIFPNNVRIVVSRPVNLPNNLFSALLDERNRFSCRRVIGPGLERIQFSAISHGLGCEYRSLDGPITYFDPRKISLINET